MSQGDSNSFINSLSSQYTEKPMEVHITGITGLRMLGIFGVILYHMFPYDGGVKGGFLGVTLFFIVSGYLLAVKSEESRRIKTFSIGGFYLKRIKRLYPQLIIVLFTTCSVLAALLPGALKGIRPEILSILLGYNNIWQITTNASYFERIANSSPFTHMWSLSNEIQLYLIWPFIFLFFIFMVKKLNSGKAIMIIGILALATAVIMPLMYTPGEDVTRLYYGTDTRIFSFLTGAFIGFRRTRYRRNKRIKNPVPYYVLFGALTAVVIVAYIFMDGESPFTYLGGMFLINLVFAGMLMLSTETRLPIGHFMDNKVFAFFGNISYEMYLWMYPVIYIFHGLHLTRIPGAHVLMFIIIVLLSKWLNTFAIMLVKRKIDMKGTMIKRISQVAVIVVAIVALGLTGTGIGSAIMAPARDTSEFDQMQKEFEENKNYVSSKHEDDETDTTIEDTGTEEPEDIVEEENVGPATLSDISLTAIGDSVMLGARPSLLDTFPNCEVDAAESRQANQALEILKALDAEGKVGDTVLLGLGTNGPFRESVGQDIIDFLGPDREIFWVNVYGDSIQWTDESNDMIDTLVANNDNVTLIDWNAEGPNHPEWFYNDGIHLRPEGGQQGYADFVKSVIEDKLNISE